MQIDLTQIAVAVIALLGAIVTKFLIPLLQSKLSAENDKLSENQRMLLRLAIDTAVKAAEQIYDSDQGKQKKAYVLGILQSMGFDCDTAAVDAEIESIVWSVHQALKAE